MHNKIAATGRRYDPTTILLHWATAGIAIFLFLSAEFWDFFPKPEKHFLILTHMSLGVLLAAILLIRIIWRLSAGIQIHEISPTLLDRGAKALHILLYVLLAAQMPLGLFTRWTDNQPLNVFGLLIASPLGTISKATGNFVDQIHDINAWIIMGLATVHASAALVHHYFLRDDVLQRMLPGKSQS